MDHPKQRLSLNNGGSNDPHANSKINNLKPNNMLRIKEIRDSKSNPGLKTVIFQEILEQYDIAKGKKAKIKSDWFTTDGLKACGYKEGAVVSGSLKSIAHDEPQYEGQVPFEITGKYYSTEWNQKPGVVLTGAATKADVLAVVGE